MKTIKIRLINFHKLLMDKKMIQKLLVWEIAWKKTKAMIKIEYCTLNEINFFTTYSRENVYRDEILPFKTANTNALRPLRAVYVLMCKI